MKIGNENNLPRAARLRFVQQRLGSPQRLFVVGSVPACFNAANTRTQLILIRAESIEHDVTFVKAKHRQLVACTCVIYNPFGASLCVREELIASHA